MKKQQHNTKSRQSLAEQVKGAFPNAGKSALPSMPHMWEQDGIDHINVHWSGETDIGKKLTLAFKLPKKVSNPLMGEFDSIQNFWGFIRAACPDDKMRTLTTKNLFTMIAETGGNHPGIVNAKAVLWEAAYLAFMQNGLIGEALMKNDLPFDVYDTSKAALPVRDKNAIWYSMALTEICNALHERRLPNFFFLLDRDYVNEHGLVASDYSARHAYVGIVRVFFRGKFPEKIDLEKYTKDLQNQFYKDVDARAAAVTKAAVKEEVAAPEELVPEPTAAPMAEVEAPVAADTVQVETAEIVGDDDVVDPDAEVSEGELLQYVQAMDVATEVPAINTSDMPADLQVEIEAVTGASRNIEVV